MDKKLILSEIKLHYKFKSEVEFAQFLDIRPQTLSSWYARNTFDIELLYAKCVDINPDWLLTGRGKMLRSESKQAIYSISEFKQHGYAPYYSELKVSAGQYDLTVIEKNEEPESWIKFPGIIAEAWFPIIGCSMEPKIYAGDTLGVVKIEHWEKVDPDKIYLVITIYDRMIKQLVVDENSNEYLWAVSLNHPRIKVLYSEIITIYRVVWAGRLV